MIAIITPIINTFFSPVYNGIQTLDNNGSPISGAKIYVRIAGTSYDGISYKDSAGKTQNSNPIISDSGGRFPAIWLLSGSNYDLILADQNGSIIQSMNDITEPFYSGGGNGG